MQSMPTVTPTGVTTPRQPWLHELEIATDGNTTVLSDRAGDIGSPGTGVFVDDRRVISHLQVGIGRDPIAMLTASSLGAQSWFLGSARSLGDPGADPTIEISRRRLIAGGVIHETVTVTSRAASPVRTTLVIQLAGDGADIATVKTGVPSGPRLDAVVLGESVGWADDQHGTDVEFSVSPSAIRAGTAQLPTEVEFDVDLGAGGRLSVDVAVRVARRRQSNFDADAGSALLHWEDVSVTADDERLAHAIRSSLIDLRHLLLTDPESPTDVFAGAGTPWYLTLFGRDSLWAARLMLPFGPELARGTLRALARRQGTVTDAQTAAEPGKILHEVRRSAFVDEVSGMRLPSVYYGTVDATQLWICVLHDAWRAGLAREDVVELLPHLQAAADWMLAACAAAPDGLIRYVDSAGTGLVNQGWKDSGDSMRRADGSVAPAPIALVEAQA